MKMSILKIAILVLCLFALPVFNAECSTQEKVQINTQASYVNYHYEYDDKTGLFDVIFENVTSNITIEYLERSYSATKNGTRIKGLNQGTRVQAYLNASGNTNCTGDRLRTIVVPLPYYNEFLDSDECNTYPEVEICKTKFLSYKLSYNNFLNMFKKQRDKLLEEPVVEGQKEETWQDIFFEYLEKYGMQVGLFVLGFFSMFVLGHSAVKRAKAKF